MKRVHSFADGDLQVYKDGDGLVMVGCGVIRKVAMTEEAAQKSLEELTAADAALCKAKRRLSELVSMIICGRN